VILRVGYNSLQNSHRVSARWGALWPTSLNDAELAIISTTRRPESNYAKKVCQHQCHCERLDGAGTNLLDESGPPRSRLSVARLRVRPDRGAPIKMRWLGIHAALIDSPPPRWPIQPIAPRFSCMSHE
jgi:hypothetical protein